MMLFVMKRKLIQLSHTIPKDTRMVSSLIVSFDPINPHTPHQIQLMVVFWFHFFLCHSQQFSCVTFGIYECGWRWENYRLRHKRWRILADTIDLLKTKTEIGKKGEKSFKSNKFHVKKYRGFIKAAEAVYRRTLNIGHFQLHSIPEIIQILVKNERQNRIIWIICTKWKKLMRSNGTNADDNPLLVSRCCI